MLLSGFMICLTHKILDRLWTTWPALEVLIHDNIVPDFPVCNKSVNGSYSGHDL